MEELSFNAPNKTGETVGQQIEKKHIFVVFRHDFCAFYMYVLRFLRVLLFFFNFVWKVDIDAKAVREALGDMLKKNDLSKFIL